MLFRGILLLVIAAALLSVYIRPGPTMVVRQPTAQEALLAWFKEHASEFDNFSKRGGPVDIRQDGPCSFCAWFCVWQSSAHEYLYRVGLAEKASQASCRGGETLRVFRHGTDWRVEREPFQIAIGDPSWQELVARLRRNFMRPDLVEVKTLLERDEVVVVTLVSSETPIGPRGPDRYRFSKGTDGLWRGYVSFDPASERYAAPEDVLIDFASKHFPTLSVLGDCAQAQEDRDNDKVCWTLKSDTGDRRAYAIGPASSLAEVVEAGWRDPGWGMLSQERATQ